MFKNITNMKHNKQKPITTNAEHAEQPKRS